MSDEEGHYNIHRSHSAEILDWDSEHRERIRDLEPEAKYGAVSESLRHSVPEKSVCTMFCHGSNCKYCFPAGPKAPWKDDQMVIKGLFSNWVTDNILAMSRPTTKAIEEFDIIGQFNQHGIKSIINLQQPGEHESCGFGNEAEGFSYRPQDFMDKDIFFYNFGWKDYGVGSLENIMDMVKVMQFAISQGKVAIHCHAGLGRTGVLIATYLLYANRESPNHVIHYIRTKRKGAVQTRSQMECIRQFAEYLQPLRVVFSNVRKTEHSETLFSPRYDGAHICCLNDVYPADDDTDDEARSASLTDFTLRQFMVRQQAYLHGQELKRLKYIPKILYCCCQRLLELAKRGKHHEFHDSIQDIRSTAPKAFINENEAGSPNQNNITDGSPLKLPLHTPRIKTRESYSAMAPTKKSYNKIMKSISGTSISSAVDGLLGSPLDRSLSSLSGEPVERVVFQMAQTEYSKEQIESIERYKELFNTSDRAYDQLYAEDDAAVISALMWYWLDSLREPVLTPQDMPAMLMGDDVLVALHGLDKAARGVVEVLFCTVTRLLPLEGAMHDDLYCRILSTLTHQNMVLDIDYLHASSSNSFRISRTSNTSGLMRSHLADRLMHFFVALTRHFQQRMEDAQVRKSQRSSQSKRTNNDREISQNSHKTRAEKSLGISESKNNVENNFSDKRQPGALVNDETGEEISVNSDNSGPCTRSDDVTSDIKLTRNNSSNSKGFEIGNNSSDSEDNTKDLQNRTHKNTKSDFNSSQSKRIGNTDSSEERVNGSLSDDEAEDSNDSGEESDEVVEGKRNLKRAVFTPSF